MRLPFLFLVPLLLASSGFTLAGGRGPARLVIMPGDMLMPPNASQPLKAAISYLGGFANPGAQRNVSAAVAWSSSDKAIATVDSKGIVTSASQTGAVVITARAGPLLAKVPLTVSTATLSGISVSPGTVVLPLGRRQQLMATGSYSDATQHDLTTAVAWNSDAAAVATVNGFGAVATHSKGGANISAGFGGKSGSASLMVTDAVLDLVVLSPANPVIVYPPWLQLTASGVYSDGSTQDLTASVTWTSAAPTTASISSSGLATSIDPGTSTITATLGTKSGNALLTVMTEPVGSVTSVSNISCAAGGVSGGSCYSLNVSCPAVADQNVLVKMAPPAGAPKGTIIFIGGGGSNGFFDTGYAYGSFIVDSLQQAGYTAAILNFNDANLGWLTGPGGPKHLACRPATAIAWVYNHLHQGGASAPLCGSGESGGSSAFAYSLSHYGLGEILSMVEEEAGPPFARVDHGCLCDQAPAPGPCSSTPITSCYYSVDNDVTGFIDTAYAAPLCSQANSTGDRTNAALFLSDSILSGNDALLAFPKTDMHFIFGVKDLTLAVPEGWEYEQAVTTQKSLQCVPNSGHSMPNFLTAAQQIVNDLTTYCKLQ